MKSISPYLLFNGNCREAMNFYKDAFGAGKVEFMTYADAPPAETNEMASGNKDEIMHSSFRNGSLTIMASDWPGHAAHFGDNIQLSIDCESVQEAEKLFNALSKDGVVKMPLADTFWGARFGMLIDKFGVHWMLNCDHTNQK